MADTARRLRGLILSATELRKLHPTWNDAMIEDYLNIYDNLVTLADETDLKHNILLDTVRVTISPFTITDEDEIFADTDLGPITINLPEGVDGRSIRIHNTGTSNNILSIVPFGTDLLFGENSTESLYDTEVVIITFETDSGWD